MTPEEALRNILRLVDGSDETEDVHALQMLLQTLESRRNPFQLFLFS
jgi:hypothetical protein